MEILGNIKASDHHIEHYNHMVTFEFPEMIQGMATTFETKDSYIDLSFKNVHVGMASYISNGLPRTIYPSECRRADLDYTSPVFASVVQKRKNLITGEVNTTVLSKILIATMPTMVGSCVCNLTKYPLVRASQECSKDVGGYFIINGNERVLVTQEVGVYNLPRAAISGQTAFSSVRSMSEETGHSVVVTCSISLNKSISDIYLTIPYVSKKVPLRVFAYAIGTDMNELYQETGIYTDRFKEVLAQNFEQVLSQDEALILIGSWGSKMKPAEEDFEEDLEEDIYSDVSSEQEEQKIAADEFKNRNKHIAYGRQVIFMEIFPHLGVKATPKMILQSVCYMIKQMYLCKTGVIKPADRDNLMYKRFENSGSLILNLYKLCFKHFFGNARTTYSGSNLNDMITRLATFVDKTVHSNFAKGVWGIPKNAYVRYGVSQILTRLSYIGTLSHLGRVNIPIGKEGKNVKIRLIHPSHFGYICLYETPEGKTCGIVINMTITATITRKYSTNFIRDLIVKRIPVSRDSGNTEIWLNNSLKMYTNNSEAFMASFKKLRREGIVPAYVNIFRDEFMNCIHIHSDAGRITRPFHDRDGNIVFLDSAECQHSTIAMYPSEPSAFEYVEIHPCFIYGIAAGCIPFSDHNQSPRNIYETSMLKQALGIPMFNYINRYDTTSEIMPQLQRSLVSTEIARAVGCAELPAGLNCIVAIMTCGSWNAEDSLVFNEAAIQRGLFHSFTYKTLVSEELKPNTNIVRNFCLPPEPFRNKILNYDLLDDKGIVKKGSYVKKRDVIVGRMHAGKDCSEIADEEGLVEKVEIFRINGGYLMAKILLKIIKIPERGDKFANMCAQKGTIGMILPQVDMPFTEEGIVPDIIINPNALPSRMTTSMFLEMVLGKYACMSGNFIDATPFSENSTNVSEKISDILTEYGFERNGSEIMINGETGEMLRSRIFIGTSYYQKLKHMVSNKIHARPFGTVTTLTRQPPAGRAKDGGLRIGEMERDALLSHGASSFLTSRIFDRSDAFHVPICNNCKVMSNHKDECHICKSTELIMTRLPFASKLLFQQLTACLIHCKFTSELL